MAVLSLRYRYLFIQTPRTGCTAIARGVLVPQLDGAFFPRHHVLDATGSVLVRKKHCTLEDLLGSGLLSITEASGLFKFTTVRNPFDSLASAFAKRAQPADNPQGRPIDPRLAEAESLTEWLELKFVYRGKLQDPRPFFPAHRWGMDYTMRFEHLQDDFDEALERIGAPGPIQIPSINVTVERMGVDYRSLYDPWAREIVEHVFGDELQLLGYAF